MSAITGVQHHAAAGWPSEAIGVDRHRTIVAEQKESRAPAAKSPLTIIVRESHVRIRTAIAVAALLPTTLAFAPSTASTDECRTDDSRTVEVDGEAVAVEYCATVLYAQCSEALDPAGKVTDPTAAITLNETAPDTSFTAAGGCGAVDEPVFSATGFGGAAYQFAASGFAFEGGNVDSMTFELHFLGPNGGYAGQDLHLDVKAAIDGVSLFGATVTPDATGQNPTSSPNAARIVATPVVSSTGASVSVRFTVTGIADLDETFANAAGSGDVFRQIEFAFSVPHTGECTTLPTNNTPRCAPSGFTAWVMGATEVPSGVTLNGEDAETTIVAGVQGA